VHVELCFQFQRAPLQRYDKLLSNFAFNFNLRPYRAALHNMLLRNDDRADMGTDDDDWIAADIAKDDFRILRDGRATGSAFIVAYDTRPLLRSTVSTFEAYLVTHFFGMSARPFSWIFWE